MDMNPVQMVEKWINEFVTVNKSRYSIKEEKDRHVIKLYTSKYEYRLSCTENYLGCIATSRKYRAGEDWLRGNDLHDGPLNEITFVKIMLNIVAYELQDIVVDDVMKFIQIPKQEVYVHND